MRGREAWLTVARKLHTQDLVWLGDFNFEHVSIRGIPDPKAERRRVWDEAVLSPRMSLLNPTGCDDSGVLCLKKVWLEKSNREAHLCAASTFVTGGRSIDAVCVSDSLRARCSMTIHNGVHCEAKGCSLGWCKEVAWSDHFLLVLEIQGQNGFNRDELTSTSRPFLCRRTHTNTIIDAISEFHRPAGTLMALSRRCSRTSRTALR